MALRRLSEAQKQRLIEFFGQAGTELVEKHLDDLEQTFGSASTVIDMIMNGKMGKIQDHRGV